MTYKDNLENKIRIIDQTISAHSLLRDENGRRAFLSDILLFSSAILLFFLSFAENELHLSNYKLIVGIFSIITIVVSFIFDKCGYKKKSIEHAHAHKELSNLKLEACKLLDDSERNIDEFLKKYTLISPTIFPVPEKDFLRCKKYHKLKVAVSKHLDNYPGTIIWIYKIELIIKGLFEKP